MNKSDLNSQDRLRAEFHVAGLLEIKASMYNETGEEEREEIDSEVRYIIARFIPEREQMRFYEMFEEMKKRQITQDYQSGLCDSQTGSLPGR